ncbi:hypothetical protein Tco_0865651, partial [Tanacetum coccineum]
LFFTWIKSPSKPETSILKKLDRVMINADFINKYGDAFTRSLPYFISNHSLVILHLPNTLDKKKKSFKFSNFIADKEEFIDVVKSEWKYDCEGFNMYKLVKKMKRLKVPLNNLAWKNGNIFQNVKNLEEELKRRQWEVEANPNCKNAKKSMSDILYEYNVVIDNPDELFSTKLFENESEIMVRDVRIEEIKEAIFGIRNDKAPGPDGFTAMFFKKAGTLWEEIAFVPGRLIQDNHLITQELLNGYNRMNGPRRCALKIDIAKAHDNMNWDFLKQILTHFGFHTNIIG